MMKEPIAIIGIGCRFPGGVTDTESFWQLLVNEVDAVGPMPAGRFDADHYYDPTPSTPGKVVTREGGFLDDIDRFDADFFGISPYEATYMDPQQRLLLQVTWEGLEAAGLDPAKLAGSNTGVFVGMWTNDYESLVYNSSDNLDVLITTGTGRYTSAGRVSYTFDFRGPSMTLDTACSSSLVAVHLACQSLWSGESNMSVAAGVNLILTPQVSIGYSRSGMLSPDARCKFGDASANGYVRSEGVGVIILKRLSDAIADGDPIRAIIRGSAVNNDGQASGSLMAPGVDGQIEMLREAYRAAEVNPGDVGYIEAHGTGTRVGDPVELEALGAVLSENRPENTPCLVGSVKTNIGHVEGAAGLAGLIKVVLCLEHGEIPASLHFREPNPNISWEDLPLKLASQRTTWPSLGKRYAGVSAFGLTGTNAHVVLEAAPQPDQPDVSSDQAEKPYILPLSAHKPQALAELVRKYETFLADTTSTLADIGYTAAVRRHHQGYRAAFVGRSKAELAEQMSHFSVSRESSPRKLVYIFSGQGGQWLGMGRQLIETEPVFREMIERCQQAMQSYIDFSLLDVINGGAGEDALEHIYVVQPAIFAVQVALAELLREQGVQPDAVIGHSMGEVAAAYVAGVLSLEDAARVICLRSQLMHRVSGLGAMAMVELTLEEAQNALAGYEDKLSVAVNNAPRSVVISGDADALEIVISQLQFQNIFCRKVKVDVAAHSPHMTALRPELLDALSDIQPQAGVVPIYSTVTGEQRSGDAFDAEYWGRNLREPVLFSTAVQQALYDGHNTFIEISPHPVLLAAIERGLHDYQLDQEVAEDVVLVEAMRRGEDELTVIAEAVGRLYAAGYEVDWKYFYPSGQVVSLPSFPWQGERYWVDVQPTLLTHKSIQPQNVETGEDLLYQLQWEGIANPELKPLSGAWLVFADQDGIGDVLSSQLLNTGGDFIFVRSGEQYRVNEHGSYEINPSQIGDFQRLLAETADQVQGVVYLWGANLFGGVSASVHELESAQQQILGGLLHLVQALVEQQQSKPVWIVTRGAQWVGDETVELSPAQATLWGFGRVLREEHPDLWGGLLDLDPESAEYSAQAVLNEISSEDGEDQVAYRGEQRYVLRLLPREKVGGLKPYTFRPDGTYLITGGLGDLGSRLAKWMIGQGARRFILMGRAELPPRRQWHDVPVESDLGRRIAIVRELEAMGASVHLASINVSDETELRTYLETYEAEGWPPIIGVIHMAAVAQDNLITRLDDAALMNVLKPKMSGAWLLQQFLGDVELFVLFSSITGLFGLQGAANYAAANTFLDGLALYRRASGREAISINWGFWKNLGVAALAGAQTSAAYMAERGLQGFSAEEGLAALSTILASNPPQVMVTPADWEQYAASGSSARLAPFFAHVSNMSTQSDGVAGDTSTVRSQFFAAKPEARRALFEDYLKDVIAQVLRITNTKIKPSEPLGNYGMNSLMGMELRNRLERDLGITLSATLVWSYPTVESMSTFLAEKIGLSLESAETPSTPDAASSETPLDDFVVNLGTLSDDDVLRELMGKS
jgi:acyl transferase domain-containing protein/acyl carrier protein